jgi:hypothetical protein
MGTIALLARLAGIRPQTYRKWQGEGLVDGPRSDKPTALDVVEAAAAAELIKELGAADGRLAWDQTRKGILSRVPASTVRVVWRWELFEAVLCADDAAVGRAVSTDERPARVVFVGKATKVALDGLHRRIKRPSRSGQLLRRKKDGPGRGSRSDEALLMG